MIGIPLKIENDLLGIVFVADRINKRLTDKCINVLEILSCISSIALKRIFLNIELKGLYDTLDGYLSDCPDIILECGRKGSIKRASQGAIDILGYTDFEFKNLNVIDVYKSKQNAYKVAKNLFKNDGNLINYRIDLYSKHGIRVPVLLSGFWVRTGENRAITGSIGFAKDLTEIEKLEKDRDNLIKYFENQVESSNIVNLSKIAMMFVHDSRNILQDVNAYIDTILDYLPNRIRNQKGFIGLENDLTQSIDLLSSYFDNLYIKGRLQRSKFEYNNIVNILFDCFQLFDYRFKKKFIKSSILLEDKIITYNNKNEILILCEAYQLKQAFMNLLLNSIYSIEQKRLIRGKVFGEIIISIECLLNEDIRIIFYDNGTGIDPSIRDKIYNPFFSTKPSDEGGGYGLALCKYIIEENHKGTLKEESIWGENCSFRITLNKHCRKATNQ